MQITLLTTEECCELLRCKVESLKDLREQWIHGVHYYRRGRGQTAPILYNRELILDWLANQDAPQTHQAAIENFRRSLPSGQRRRFGKTG
jgi:hypothetical protein